VISGGYGRCFARSPSCSGDGRPWPRIVGKLLARIGEGANRGIWCGLRSIGVGARSVRGSGTQLADAGKRPAAVAEHAVPGGAG